VLDELLVSQVRKGHVIVLVIDDIVG